MTRFASIAWFVSLLAGLLPAQQPPGLPASAVTPVTLDFSVHDRALVADLQVDESKFFGIVLLSLRSDLTHYLTDLPPLLSEPVVMGYGFARPTGLRITALGIPVGRITIHGQAVVFGEWGILASDVVTLLAP